MTGSNFSVLNIPAGVFRNATQYAAGKHWYDVNLVRWIDDVLVPVGGWVLTHTLASGTAPVRNMHSWRDLLRDPWFALGSADRLWGARVVGSNQYNFFNITPASLVNPPVTFTGYGRGAYGSGAYGLDSAALVNNPMWSLDNFGKLLVAVHSVDGRLFSWDPSTPATVAAPVTNAPASNQLVITTEEEFLMVLGGKNNPRQVKWASQRSLTEWTPTETNSAGGFDLRADGAIIAAVRTSGGILVVTDADVHMIEYVGPPNYYGRRRISEEGGCLGQNCIAATPKGAMWISGAGFWFYNGSVSRLICPVSDLVFFSGDLSQAHLIHMGLNEFTQEVWVQYPHIGSIEADKYVFVSYANEFYWSFGSLSRSAWMNPVWQVRPIAVDGLKVYSHEIGVSDNGASRNGTIYAETGAIEVGEGDEVMKIDRVYPDMFEIDTEGVTTPASDALTMTFKLRQAPAGPLTVYGPVLLDSPQGYSTVRLRARQVVMRVDQVKDVFWGVGKTRIRAKAGGKR